MIAKRSCPVPRFSLERGQPVGNSCHMLWRSRTDFWGHGPDRREAEAFSFHKLRANEPEEEVEPHGHEEAHFVLVLSGGYMSSARDAPIVSATPILIYNPPGTEHQDRFLHGRGSFLAISGGSDFPDMPAICLRDPYGLKQARDLASAFMTAEPFMLEAGALQLHALVQPKSSDEALAARQPPSWLRRAVEFIFTSDATYLTVAEVARDASVHPVHLARVFKEYLGCAPGEYLRGRRLEHVARVLGEGAALLADAAQIAGFVDQAHMTRAFRQNYQTTPGHWRKRSNVAPVQDRH